MRKGVVPVVFDENKEVKINGIVISKKDGKEIGKVVASRGGGVGLALVRFAKVENVSEGVSIETVDESATEEKRKRKRSPSANLERLTGGRTIGIQEISY